MVWRILKRLSLNRLPTSERYKSRQKRWKRYDKQHPGHHVQIDVKFIEPITTAAGTRKHDYQYTAIDDCTRLRILRIYPRSDQKTAIQFLDYVLSRLPFQIEKIQTANGAEFQTQFHWHVLDQGVGHIYIRPATPRLNGKSVSLVVVLQPSWSDSGKGMTVVSCGRFVGRLCCGAVVRTSQTELT
ncbi:DDE-type integrase/transposase/recombinase [Lentzea flava]|uniref:Integrase catalytic domain-containing protein n=1 Tax=Lentzea flava TaxID=103732 RepID=A0ABQ2VHF2_9PSEU|nr:DDE-type integrase/transposase/recombinase [Lentzea flava]MCP2205413.1 Integrase core domain-containing protein [Lentzea flava]GGU86539.1 hypothetical protein GCM10010178_90650 [Lentzea flava]